MSLSLRMQSKRQQYCKSKMFIPSRYYTVLFLFNIRSSISIMAAAPAGQCNDRPNHPGLGAGVPCNASRRNCVAAAAHPGGPFSVCDTCATDTVSWGPVQFQLARLARWAKPQLPNAVNPALIQARDLGFRTLLCDACQEREIELRGARDTNVAPVEHTKRWADRRFMRHYPHDTCKCRQKLFRQDRPRRQSHRHCHPCRMALCTDIANDWTANETWLENTGRDNAWNTVGTRVATRRRRNREGTFRACRCGNTVEPIFGSRPGHVPPGPAIPPTVYQCLSCEGIVHIGLVPAGLKGFNPRRHDRNVAFGRQRGRGRV